MSFYTVFSRNNCEWCRKAVKDLYSLGERPIIHRVDKDHAMRTLLLMAGLKIEFTVDDIIRSDITAMWVRTFMEEKL